MTRRKMVARSAAAVLAFGLVGGLAPNTNPATARTRTTARRVSVSFNPNPAWCKFSDTLPMTDMTEAQMMDEMMFYPRMKRNLTPATCQKVIADLAAAKQYGMQFPTAAAAVRGGFRMIAGYVKGQGAHYIGPNGISSTFDPKVPNFLLFDGNGPTAKLAGLMWLVNSGQMPPTEGYPGGNDHWHRHHIVCFVGGVIVAEDISDAQCNAMGGGNLDISDNWMLHAWIVPHMEYLPDVFRPHVPFLP